MDQLINPISLQSPRCAQVLSASLLGVQTGAGVSFEIDLSLLPSQLPNLP